MNSRTTKSPHCVVWPSVRIRILQRLGGGRAPTTSRERAPLPYPHWTKNIVNVCSYTT